MVLKAQSMKRCSDLYCKNGYEKGACPCGQAPFMVFRKPLGLSELYCGELKKIPETICLILRQAFWLQSA